MKKSIVLAIMCLLLIGANAFAGDGDLIVNGKVGIGTMSPGAALDVRGAITSTGRLTIHGSDTNVVLNPGSGNEGMVGTADVGESLGVYGTTAIKLYTNNGPWGERMRIASNGNVGIGTTNPIVRFQVGLPPEGISTAPDGFSFRSYDTAGNRAITMAQAYASNLGETLAVGHMSNNASASVFTVFGGNGTTDAFNRYLLKVMASGNVGIGTSNPGYLLDVNGVARINGTVYSSDIRWKKNITPLENSLDQVMKLQGVSYDWKVEEFKEKNFEEGRQIGFIAQEVEKVIPELVKTDSEGYKAVSYEKITAVLVEAMKEQQREIEELKSEIKRMKAGN